MRSLSALKSYDRCTAGFEKIEVNIFLSSLILLYGSIEEDFGSSWTSTLYLRMLRSLSACKMSVIYGLEEKWWIQENLQVLFHQER